MSRLGAGWVLGVCWILFGCSGESASPATDAGSSSGGSSTDGGGSGTGGGSSGGTAGSSGSGGGTSGSGGSSTGGSSGGASTDGGGPLCSTPGWCELLDTKLDDVCANSDGCWGVVSAWSSAVADTQRNRLVVWGGGHNDYYGNEVYALDLNGVKMSRLNEPSPPNDYGGDCIEKLSDGLPNSRHTYGGLAYIAHTDQMFAFSGSLACGGGYFSDATWTLDLASLSWTERASGPTPVPGSTSDYDPVTKKVYLHDLDELWAYDVDSNSYQVLESNNGEETDYHMTGVFDPGRKLWIMFGGGQARAYTIGNGSAGPMQIWDSQTSGCDGIQNLHSPGLAYYPDEKVLVGWAGGDDVYLFDPDTKTCTVKTYGGGPGPQAYEDGGTNGRFRYFPALGVFALVNASAQNAYTLRLD